MIDPGIRFTEHALEQFVRRHAPDMTLTQARTHLQVQSASAVQMNWRTALGDMQWRISDPDCILVVKRDSYKPGGKGARRASGKAVLTCVTVLPYQEEFSIEDVDPSV